MNNLWVPMYNVVQSNGENRNQPDDYNWCKHKGYLVGATMLQCKEADQNDTGKQDKFAYQEQEAEFVQNEYCKAGRCKGMLKYQINIIMEMLKGQIGKNN